MPSAALLDAWLAALVPLAFLLTATWLVSLVKRDASIVDPVWPLAFLVAVVSYVARAPSRGARTWIVVVLVGLWALRLSAYLVWRGLGQPEDFRYARMRRRLPLFPLTSLLVVFGLQALLAWLVSAPLVVAVDGSRALGPPDALGVLLWTVGMAFETVGDWQLARFKADPASAGVVMDRGLWRYTRHPNYFGDCCVWWGFYALALGAGGWWTVLGPLLMTWLLLRVSGVALLEHDIGRRRPGYAEYVRRTSAFVPRPPLA